MNESGKFLQIDCIFAVETKEIYQYVKLQSKWKLKYIASKT